MKRVPRTRQQPRRSLILWPTMVLALAVSACGAETKPVEGMTPAPEQEQPEDDEPCTITEDSPPPTLSISDVIITLQCGDAWEAPEVTAVDACGQPLPVEQYNTGDDDEDGIASTIDPDDVGPGPDLNTEGVYYVQYLTWDPTFFHVSTAILAVSVVNCPD